MALTEFVATTMRFSSKSLAMLIGTPAVECCALILSADKLTTAPRVTKVRSSRIRALQAATPSKQTSVQLGAMWQWASNCRNVALDAQRVGGATFDRILIHHCLWQCIGDTGSEPTGVTELSVSPFNDGFVLRVRLAEAEVFVMSLSLNTKPGKDPLKAGWIVAKAGSV